MKKLFLTLVFCSLAFAKLQDLTLQEALDLLAKNNDQIKIAKLEERMAAFDEKIAQSYNYGSLDLIFNALRSNDAGNVFGFKLQSREAKFIDFGFDQFLAPMGQVLEAMNANPGGLPQGFTQQMGSILDIQPQKLNYPKARNHFQTKVQYKLPIYTGMKLTMYKKITNAMKKMKHLDYKKMRNEMVYQTKKTFYDITLVENYIKNLELIKNNMDRLENIIKNFKAEGYAKDTDVLEVQAKKAEVESYLNQARLNRALAYQYLSFLIDEEVESIHHVAEIAPLPSEPTAKLVDRTIDMQKVRLGQKITSFNVRLKKSGFYPMVGAFGEYGSADDELWNRFLDKDAYTVGAQLKWNLFEGGKTNAEVQKAKIQKIKMQEQYNLAKRGLALKINQIKTAVKSKDFDIKAQSKQYELAKKIYQMYEEKYKEGIERISNVLIKQSEEIQVLLRLLKTKTERNEKVFELERLLDKENK